MYIIIGICFQYQKLCNQWIYLNVDGGGSGRVSDITGSCSYYSCC